MPEPGDQLTLHEAAERLGVHYMTVYRQVRTGRLPAQKVGAEWRVAAADVEARLQAPARARGGRGQGPGRTERWAVRLTDRLVAGDRPGTMAVVEDVLAGGADLEVLYFEVVTPSMADIGWRWQAGELDIADEHRAVVVLGEVLGQVAPRFARAGRTRGTIVLGAAPDESHAMPVMLLSDLLRARGFTVDNLGADVPGSAFAAAASRAERLVAVGISLTRDSHLDGVRDVVAAVRERAPGAAVVLGGAGSPAVDAMAEDLDLDGVAPSGPAALDLFESLVPARGPDRRPGGPRT